MVAAVLSHEWHCNLNIHVLWPRLTGLRDKLGWELAPPGGEEREDVLTSVTNLDSEKIKTPVLSLLTALRGSRQTCLLQRWKLMLLAQADAELAGAFEPGPWAVKLFPRYYLPHPAMMGLTCEEWDKVEEQCGPGLEAEFEEYMTSLKKWEEGRGRG